MYKERAAEAYLAHEAFSRAHQLTVGGRAETVCTTGSFPHAKSHTEPPL